MLIFDAHCDTVSEILDRKTILRKNDCHLDLERAYSPDGWVQVFAAFVKPAVYRNTEIRRTLEIIDNIYFHCEQNSGRMSVCINTAEIKKAIEENKLAALISIEGGEALQGKLSTLRMFHRLGVRSLVLTWNYRNELADGAWENSSGSGLSDFGRSVVSEMNRLGMLADASHISEKGFWDVVEMSTAPVIASHSNSRAVCNHPRNLTDSQFEALKAKRGVTGINLNPYFLNNTESASLDEVVAHIEHFASLGGENNIGLGCDFDGIVCTPSDVRGAEDVPRIFERLLALNYKEETVKKIAGGNMLRVYSEVIG